MLLAVDSVLMNQQYGTFSKRKKKFVNMYEATPEIAKVTSIVSDKAIEKLVNG